MFLLGKVWWRAAVAVSSSRPVKAVRESVGGPDPATLAFGVADEHHVPAAGPVVDWRGDAQLLGLHFCPPAVFLQQLRAVECVRLGEAKCPIAWEDERKNGAGDRDRTDDIQLGKRLSPKALECRERGRIGDLGADHGSVASRAQSSKGVRNLAVFTLSTNELM